MNTKIIALACLVRSVNAFLFMVATTALTLVLSSNGEAVVVSTDYFVFDNGPVDFGGPTHFLGSPQGNAVVTWNYDTSSGQVVATARVQGTLYWDDLFSSGCTRLTIRFRNEANTNLAVRTVDECGPGGNANDSANKTQVDESFSSPNLTRIRIDIARTSAGESLGPFFTTVFAPLSRQFETFIDGGRAHCGDLAPFPYPSEPCVVGFNRDNGTMNGFVTGPLFVDLNKSGVCARGVVTFRTIGNAILSDSTRDTCGERFLGDSFDSGSLFRIRLHVGEISGGDFTNVQLKTFDFNGQTGNFTVASSDPSVSVHERLNYAFTWTVPEPLNWHDLQLLQLRISDETETILWVGFDEASNSFSLFNEPSGRFGRAFPAGSRAQLQSSHATLHLADTSITPVASALGTGPTSPSVTLNLAFSFKPSARGRTFRVDIAASDDLGNEDPFTFAGTLSVND